MHIVISAPFRMLGGGQVHLSCLLAAWDRTGIDRAHTITLVTRTENLSALPITGRVRVVPIDFRAMPLPMRMGWEQVALPRLARRLEADVLLCPGNVAPWRSFVPTVVVMRNAAPFCEGLGWRRVGPAAWMRFRVLGALMRLSASTATRTIFVSHYFRSRFVRWFGFPPERGDVIYHGRDGLPRAAADPATLADLGIRSPYFLCVGHLYPHKNILALIEGYAKAAGTMRDHDLRLVIAGKFTDASYARRLRRLVRDRGLEEWVVFLGAVPYGMIATLLAGCTAFVFQSTCENCPNTLIEALAVGLPIACSRASVMPEIAGDAALYFDPDVPKDIARVLREMATNPDLRRDLGRRARIQALRFPTWDDVGRDTFASLERAVGGSRANGE